MQITDAELLLIGQALSEPVRLRILRLLPLRPKCEEMCNVSELAEELGVSQPAVSRHLGVLKRAGLVTSERVCQGVYYARDPERAQAVIKAINDILRGA